jgi:LytS/YehU family sensor histidine kinase
MEERRQPPKAERTTRIVSVLDALVLAGLPVATILALVTGGVHRAVLVGIAYVCGMSLFWFPVHWLAAIGSWRSSDALWRKRMASGFYKTLPPIKDDDDD